MDRLPLELLLLIVKNSGHESLIPLRLVNNAFAAAAAPSLFEIIPLWIGVRSLERLTAISEHPQLSQYPKKIIFSPLRIIDYENDGLYEDKVKDMLEYQPASVSMRALTLAKHMSAYRSCIEMQRPLSSNGLDVTILSRAFSQLPHLRILHVDVSDTRIGSAELIHAFGTFEAEDLLTYDCIHVLPVLIKALAASAIKIKVFKLGCDEGYSYSSISDMVGNYSTAASRVRPYPSSLLPYISCPARITSRALSETFCAENMHFCKDALRSMRELKVGRIRVEGNQVSEAATALRSLVQCAWGLEVVELWFPLRFCSPRPTLGSVMPWYTFNKIKELHIHDYDINAAALRDIFHRNRHTIAKADFRYVAISGSDWSTALIQLRTLDLLRLEVFILTSFGKENGV